MEIIKPGTHINFMRYRVPVIATSCLLVFASIVALFVPGPNLGIDFAGGTEVQLTFRDRVTSAEIREALQSFGYARPDVVAVEGVANAYMIRVGEVNALPEDEADRLKQALERAIGGAGTQLREWKPSPGGEKLSLRFTGVVDPEAIRTTLEEAGARIRGVNAFGASDEFRYEVHLVGVGDEIVTRLIDRFGERAPEEADRIEWVGPKAGAQLREAAMKSILYAIAFIMVYVAFRFDLRFAPGGVVALLHDVFITLGIYILFRKEVNLTTVAALLTILGYSINDTIVVYDRIRENMARMRDTSLRELINISTSQTFSRTIITGGTTMVSVSAFFIWGTPVIQDISFALFIGIAIGTYSSIYVAAPLTEYIDRRFFRTARRPA